uniref:Secreted protein n=1 Tax=Achlya hypogyna TaxID=1202772 RepID=A0A0A7CPE5_ACHHY|nr:secreted protein [Achlya hypogyna]
MATSVLALCFSSLTANSTNTPEPKYQTRTVDTVVYESSAKWPKYMGKGSAIQMYTTAALSAQILVSFPETTTVLEKVATVGPLVSLSAVIFFGAKYLGERVITNVTSCRTVGQRGITDAIYLYLDEFLKIQVAGGLRPKTFECYPKGVSALRLISYLKLVSKDENGMCNVKINRTTFWLDLGKAQVHQEQSLKILLDGKPLLVRKGKIKKAARA